MNNGKAIENQKEDKKVFGKFLVFMILCGLGGAVVGIGAVKMQKYGLQDIWRENLMRGLEVVSLFGSVIFTTVLFIWASLIVSRCRRRFAGWNGEDESVLNQIEGNLSCILTFSSLNLILCYFFFGAGFYFLLGNSTSQISMIVRVAVLIGALIYMMIVVMIVQKRAVNFEKELNPEKDGSIYDFKFRKKWMQSCDEAEKLQIYKCAYKSYQTASGACIILWLISIFGIFFWDFGLMPLTIVIIFWMIMNLSYSIEAMRLSKHPEEIMK